MPKALIVFYSLTRTTAQVAERIAAGLNSNGMQVELCNLRDERAPAAAGYDLLGIGTPTYYYRPPFNVMDYLEQLPDLAGKPAFAFTLYGSYRGDCGNLVRQVLNRKGAGELGYFHCRGADLFPGYLKEGYLFSPDHPTRKELAEAEAFGRAVAARLAGSPVPETASDPKPAPVYRLERWLMNRWLVEQVYRRLFRVSWKKCTSCGLCMKQCPTKTITKDRKGRPVWGRNCLLCLQCEMLCPEEAITSPVSWPMFRAAMRYNVRRAMRDNNLDHVRIVCRRGRIRRI
jgi:flavodoxin/NAD-dependent dihydropyrimidine dehydrogenase PreA subunit